MEFINSFYEKYVPIQPKDENKYDAFKGKVLQRRAKILLSHLRAGNYIMTTLHVSLFFHSGDTSHIIQAALGVLFAFPTIYFGNYLSRFAWFHYFPIIMLSMMHIEMTEKTASLPSFKVQPLFVLFNAIIFYHIGLAGRWYVFSLSYLGLSFYFALRMVCTFGFEEDILLVFLSMSICFSVHISICYEEEMRLRAHFYSEMELKNTKNAFQGTVEALPEPLVVMTGQELILSNLAFKDLLKQGEGDPLESQMLRKIICIDENKSEEERKDSDEKEMTLAEFFYMSEKNDEVNTASLKIFGQNNEEKRVRHKKK